MIIDIAENTDTYADQLSGFDYFLSPSAQPESFTKTVIRLPLRTAAGARQSRIKNEVVEPAKIQQLFHNFIKEELHIVLLFLTHVSCIEIYEVDDQEERRLAKAEIIKSDVDCDTAGIETYRCQVDVSTLISDSACQSWRISHVAYSDSDAADCLSNRLGYDVGPMLKRQKLLPKVALAMPISSTPRHDGRLYTYLPLPLSTGFPCHIHGLFALTPDRQHLRNAEETGVVDGVDRSVSFTAVMVTILMSDTVFLSLGTASCLILIYQLPGRSYFLFFSRKTI